MVQEMFHLEQRFFTSTTSIPLSASHSSIISKRYGVQEPHRLALDILFSHNFPVT